MTYKDYMKEFENYHIYLEHSEETLLTYAKWINLFFDKTNLDVDKVEEIHVTRFMMSNREWSSATKHNFYSSIKSFYKVLISLKLVNMDNPCENIRVPKVKNEEKIPLTRVEQGILIKNSKNARDKAILTTMFNTGMRVMEIQNLTLEQYKNRGEYNEINLTVTKGDKDRTIFLNEACVQAIEEYLPTRKETDLPFLFISNGGKKMDRTCMSRTIKTIAKRCNEFEEDRIDKMCNHLLRTSFATTKANEDNVPLAILSKVMGHATTAVTSKVYVKADKEKIRMAMC